MTPPPFVGRQEELERLRELWETTLRLEGPTAALLTGEPGSGKSRLLVEARRRMGPAAAHEIFGYEPEASLPLGSAAAFLRALADASEQGTGLRALLFDPEPSAASPEPIWIFEAAHRALSGAGPALILLDDLQWVDHTTLALVRYLLRAARDERQRPLGLIAAARPGETARSFGGAISRAVSEGHAAVMDLAPLDRDAGVRLARSVLPDLTDAGALEVWRRAGGSPFWIEALAAAGGAEEDLGHVIAGRLRGLGVDAATLLALVVVRARPMTPDEAASVLGWDPERVRRAAEEPAARGLLTVEGGVLGVAHDLIRTAAVRQVPGELRRSLHGLIADRLEAKAGDDGLILLDALEHRRSAGRPVGDLALRVAASPRRRLLGSEGLHRLEALVDAEDTGGGERLDLHRGVATLASELGEHRRALRRWVLVADRNAEPTGGATPALEASRAALELGRVEEARRWLDRARAAGHIEDPALRIELDAHESLVLRLLERRTEEARRMGGRALAGARRLFRSEGRSVPAEHRRAYLSALRAALDDARFADDFEGMLDLSEEAVTAARGFDEWTRLTASFWMGFARYVLGRAAEAADTLERVWEEARVASLPGMMLQTGWILVIAGLAWGRLARAEAMAATCAGLAERTGGGGHRFTAWMQAVRLHRGDWRSAAAELRREIGEERDPHERALLRESLFSPLALLERGRAEAEVVDEATAARAEARDAGCERCAGEIELKGAQAMALVGDPERSALWLEAWRGGAHAVTPHVGVWRRAADAALRTARLEPEAAEAWAAAAGDAERVGRRIDAVWARILRAEALAGRDTAGASVELRAAGDTAERMGAATEAGVAEAALRRMGVRTWHRGRSGNGEDPLGRLTEREREIARLVARGASNPEIASTLFLSRKTIERHVSNILAKLGIRNRTELAARIGMGGAPR